MADRPPIPAELKRRVLVEAGHRCAIHTCRHPEVDVHHIVPWERCREHSYDNLIALCPNCHRRADASEIDRISLRMYKARLTAAVGIRQGSDRESAGGRSTSPGSVLAWVTDRLREAHDVHPLYVFEWEFPQFDSAEDEIQDINLLQQAEALAELCSFREIRVIRERGSEDQWYSQHPSQLAASFEVVCCTQAIISIRYSVFHYGAGAAHPNHWTRVANYQRGPLLRLPIATLLKPGKHPLEALSKYCVEALTREKSLDGPSEWILSGAGADLKNFEVFNVTPRGLLFTFDEYQVGSYAEGPSQVEVPQGVLRSHMRDTSRVLEVWGS